MMKNKKKKKKRKNGCSTIWLNQPQACEMELDEAGDENEKQSSSIWRVLTHFIFSLKWHRHNHRIDPPVDRSLTVELMIFGTMAIGHDTAHNDMRFMTGRRRYTFSASKWQLYYINCPTAIAGRSLCMCFASAAACPAYLFIRNGDHNPSGIITGKGSTPFTLCDEIQSSLLLKGISNLNSLNAISIPNGCDGWNLFIFDLIMDGWNRKILLLDEVSVAMLGDCWLSFGHGICCCCCFALLLGCPAARLHSNLFLSKTKKNTNNKQMPGNSTIRRTIKICWKLFKFAEIAQKLKLSKKLLCGISWMRHGFWWRIIAKCVLRSYRAIRFRFDEPRNERPSSMDPSSGETSHRRPIIKKSPTNILVGSSPGRNAIWVNHVWKFHVKIPS